MNIILTEKQLKLFWSKVDKNGLVHPYKSELGNCWNWTASLRDRYPRFSINRKSYGAHRISIWISGRDIPTGECGCHTCDNRLCVNPEHLIVGTHDFNMKDKKSKNRQYKPKGDLHHNSKLIESQIFEIIELYSTGNYYQREIASMFNISRQHISCIVNKKQWKHI